jgi:predicted DsbA family dithiol-disulfide isomerase
VDYSAINVKTTASEPNMMQIEIWSDIACPWCYVGKRRFERALDRFEHRDDVSVVWRSFELDPSAPTTHHGSQAQLLASKYGLSPTQAEAMNARMTAAAREEGLDFHFESVRVGNTFDAHRIVQLARESGRQDAMKERLMRAYFTEGEAIGTPSVLERLAREAGLVPDRVRETLAGDAFVNEVRADELRARRLGINGVPFFVLDGRYGVSGAQSPDVLLEALRQAYSEVQPTVTISAGERAAQCDDGGCAI